MDVVAASPSQALAGSPKELVGPRRTCLLQATPLGLHVAALGQQWQKGLPAAGCLPGDMSACAT